MQKTKKLKLKQKLQNQKPANGKESEVPGRKGYKPIDLDVVSVLLVFYNLLVKKVFSSTEELKKEIETIWVDICVDPSNLLGTEEVPTGFVPDALFKASFVKNEYAYLSMPDGQCGAYACALSCFIHQKDIGWVHKHDFAYAEKTGSLTAKSEVKFCSPGELGMPIAHENHAYVCFQVPDRSDPNSVYHHKQKAATRKQVLMPMKQSTLSDMSKSQKLTLHKKYNEESKKTKLSFKLFQTFLDALVDEGKPINNKNIDKLRVAHNRAVAAMRNQEGVDLIRMFFKEKVSFWEGPSDEGVIDCLDLAGRFGQMKARMLKDYVVGVLSQPQRLNVIEFQGDNRIRRLLPILYKSVKYEQITISVPVDARDSDVGLPDFKKIANKPVNPIKLESDNVVGSISVMMFRAEIEKDGLSRFEHLINNFNMDMAATFTGVFNHNEPKQEVRTDSRTLFVSKANSAVQVNSSGSVSSHVLNQLAQRGLSMANRDNNYLRSYNGSNHPAPRLIADLHAAISINRVIERGKNFLQANPNSVFYIVDIGAKYAKHASLYYKALFDYSDRVCYVGVRPNDDVYDQKYHEDAEGRQYPHYSAFSAIIRNMQIDFRDERWRHWTEETDRIFVEKYPVVSPQDRIANIMKAREEELKKAKHREFLEREKNERAPAHYLSEQNPPVPGLVNVFRGTIQEFHALDGHWMMNNQGLPRDDGSVVGVSLDSAYYLSGLIFGYPIEFSMMTFPAICGKWQLPSNQGYAQIYATMDEDTNVRYHVCMSASGQARPYEHPLVFPTELNQTLSSNGIIYHQGYCPPGKIAFRAAMHPREAILEEYCDERYHKYSNRYFSRNVMVRHEDQMYEEGIRGWFGVGMKEWRKTRIIEERVRELNSNCEVDWTAVCAHLYVLKDATTPEQLEKKQNSTMVLQSHLKAFNVQIKCMKPLIKINFDEHSMVRASQWFEHYQKILPFIVGIISPDARRVEYRSRQDIGLWDFVLAPQEEVLITAQQNYEGPLVAGRKIQSNESLCYNVDDLKAISGRIQKQQYIHNLYKAIDAQLDPEVIKKLNLLYQKIYDGEILKSGENKFLSTLFKRNPKLQLAKDQYTDFSELYYQVHVFREIDMKESRAVVNEVWHVDKTEIYDMCRNEKPDYRKPFQSGFTIMGMKAYEWSNRSLTNLLYSMSSRLLVARCEPDPNYLVGFRKFCSQQIDRIVANIELYFEGAHTMGVEAWLKDHPNWSKKKKMLYRDQIEKQLLIQEEESFQGFFEVMTKSGEQHLAPHLEMDINGRCVTEKTRIRPIQNPKGDYIGLLTWTNEFHIAALKNATPCFVSGLNGQQFSEMYREFARSVPDCVPVSADGSAFDSTQWAEIIEIVDDYYYKKVWPVLTRYFNFSERVSSKLLDLQLNKISKIKYKWNNRTFLTQFVKGTTPSGHPTRTTVGNTLRTIMYFSYWMYQAGCLQEVPLFDYKLRQDPSPNGFKFERLLKRKYNSGLMASGDDALPLVPRQFADRLKDCIFAGSVRDAKKHEVKGLGGCYKEVLIGKSWVDMEFCSKLCFAISSKEEGESVIVRDFIKALGTSNFYTGSNKSICQNPFQHSYLIGTLLLEEVGPRLNKVIGMARIQMGQAWNLSQALENISLHRMMLDQFDIDEDLQNKIDDYQMQALGLSYQQYVDLAIHAIDCTRIGDVIKIPCDVKKPDTYVAGFGPMPQLFTENNNNTMTDKKNKKQVKSKDQKKQIIQSKNKPTKMNYGLVQYRESKDKYAQSILMPEITQGGRIPTRFAVPTATIQHYEKFDVRTNDLGQAVVCMYPNDTGKLAALDAPDGLDLSNFAAWKGGAVKASIATNVISKYRVVSAVMRYHFTQNALKQQGSRTIALVPGSNIYQNSDGAAGINHAVLEKCMYHETNDVQRSARMIWLPMDPADNILMGTGTGSARDAAYVALMLTGCAPSEHIGYVEITVNLEYVPRLEYWNTVVRELVPSDSSVQDRVESVVSNNPALSHQPLNQLQKLWTQIKPHLISTAIQVARSALSA